MSFELPTFHEFLPVKLIYPAHIKTRTYDSTSQVSTIRELALSIKTHGLLQPIIVRPTNKGFEIVAGHRRFLACKYLRWKKIAVCIKDLSDQEAFEVQIVENIQRCSLNCIEEGRAFNEYVNNYGWGGVTNLANKIMKSEQYISRRIQLLKLPSVIQGYLINDDISVSQASELLSLNENNLKIMVDRIISEDLSIREIRTIKKNIMEDFAYKNPIDYSTNKTTNFVRNRPTYTISTTSEDFMNESSNEEIIRNYNDTNQQLLLLKKVKLCLKISLSRMDNLIHEFEEIDTRQDPSSIIQEVLRNKLLNFRISLHSLLDDDIKLILKLRKNNL